AGSLKKADLQYRLTVELDGDTVLVLAPGAHVRVQPTGAPVESDRRAYRGAIEVFANTRRTLTVLNELPLEEYLRGVVPNELSPVAFGQIEALKAQAVAARTYIQRNLGQSREEGYDVGASDSSQAYLGVPHEDPMATQAIDDTVRILANHEGKPIYYLTSSPSDGRGE